MNKTKIDWADMTWNPVTGCLHGCEYCYARKIANRFGGASETHYNECVGEECQWVTESTGGIHDIEEPVYDVDRGHKSPYPFEFDPTFHRYRLSEPAKIKKSKTIFVCSMADLFGEWVPEEWIRQVLDACKQAPQHRYLFLTKNPTRYTQLAFDGQLPKKSNFWYGHTITNQRNALISVPDGYNSFISAEPLLGPLAGGWGYAPFLLRVNWTIIGAETGNRKGKVIPEKSWIDDIVATCRETQIPIFMKESLRSLMGEDFKQEYPWKEGD